MDDTLIELLDTSLRPHHEVAPSFCCIASKLFDGSPVSCLSSTPLSEAQYINYSPNRLFPSRKYRRTEIDQISKKNNLKVCHTSFFWTAEMPDNRIGDVLLIFPFTDEKSKSFYDLLTRIFKECFAHALNRRQIVIREKAVTFLPESKDVNSFLHKILNYVCSFELGYEAASVFLHNPQNDFLFLAATTGISTHLQKKDIYYLTSSQSGTTRAFRNKQFVMESMGDSEFNLDQYQEITPSSKHESRLHLPIGLDFEDALNQRQTAEEKASNAIGVLRVINPVWRADNKVKKRTFSWEDIILIEFISDIIHAVTENHFRMRVIRNEVETVVHGLSNDTALIHGNLVLLKSLIHGNEERGVKPFPGVNLEITHRQQLSHLFDDTIAFAEDLRFQVERARTSVNTELSHLIPEGEACQIDNIMTQVLMPSLRLGPTISRVHNKKPIRFNNLKNAGAQNLPPVKCYKSGLLMVVRNLIENSVKYTPEGTEPWVKITFDVQRKTVSIRLDDNGIGVPESEEPFLFRAGFRSSTARKLSHKGTGIGLHQSREFLKQMGGDLLYENIRSGSRFTIVLPRSGNERKKDNL